MFAGAEWLLIGAVAAVGVLHTIVPDHWVPITLIARQRGWTKTQTARASLLAGTGHVLSTLLIAIIVWLAGVATARTLGSVVSTLASIALIGFGGWIAISSWLAMRKGGEGHGHSHGHDHGHVHATDKLLEAGGIHGPELERIETANGAVDLSIFETGAPPRFRLTGEGFDRATLVTKRDGGAAQTFAFVNRGAYWEAPDIIPEPHGFELTLTLGRGDEARDYGAVFAEHEHGQHQHPETKTSSRTALLLILGSSPMVEGIPAFFAAGRYGLPLIITMSIVFGLTTIITYVVLCVGSVAGLQRVSMGPWEKYGEVLSGAFIALIGLVFWIWPLA